MSMRRTTLGPISSSQLNARSTIASNASARVSVGAGTGAKPTALRRSVGLTGGAPTRRVSTAARLPPAPAPRTSTSRQSAGSVGAGINGRRSSAYGSRGSIAQRGSRADPRPLTDKAYMNSCIHSLIEFLSDRQYDHVLSPKILKGPTKKDFRNIIQFLFRQIDPNYEFGPKFEDDVAMLFKNLRYPFAISKTALVAVGSPHTWPALLGTIAWIIELLSYDEEVQRSSSAEDFDGEIADKAFFEYLGNAYRSFMAADDEHYNALEQQLYQRVGDRNQVIRDETSAVEQANETLRRRIEQAKVAKSSLPALNSKKADYLSDREKFKTLVAKLQAHQLSVDEKTREREEELRVKEMQLAERQREIQALHVRIENQELSAEDVEHVAKERARLQEQIQLVAQRQKDIQSTIWRQETQIAGQMDKLEELVKRYSETATRMKLVPAMAKNANGMDYEIEIDAHTGGDTVAQNLSIHLKHTIRPALVSLKRNRVERASVALDEALELQTDVEKSEQLVKFEHQKNHTMDAKLKKFEEVNRREREMLNDTQRHHMAHAEEVEMQIERIQNERDSATIAMQSRQQLEQAKRAYAAMEETYRRLLEKNRLEMANVLVACTDHKETVNRQISSLEAEVNAFWS
ncbi:TPA: hypothetical protein N0F65_002900 [Lagenidium giganteum]|uniref:Kinetochore protein NDC80 n=1 Tax=Lagenidium giganteum TaxID=4803 RepID=A0AAV2ZDU5_9STRA|nr:TPA: hypothetical protein N0F65_002900 [Lagenidium giganteum]